MGGEKEAKRRLKTRRDGSDLQLLGPPLSLADLSTPHRNRSIGERGLVGEGKTQNVVELTKLCDPAVRWNADPVQREDSGGKWWCGVRPGWLARREKEP